jgi:hypothetical protein
MAIKNTNKTTLFPEEWLDRVTLTPTGLTKERIFVSRIGERKHACWEAQEGSQWDCNCYLSLPHEDWRPFLFKTGFCSVGTRKISLPFYTWLQQAAMHKPANFNTCAQAHAHTHSRWASETTHLQPSLLIITFCTDNQMTLSNDIHQIAGCLTSLDPSHTMLVASHSKHNIRYLCIHFST